jgi:ADP-heptose:LPS heptosyltransferase
MMPAGHSGRTKAGDIDWGTVERVLVVKLRSIGDTVLSTPSLIALRRFLPNAQVDILLEDWVAPLLSGFDAVDNVLKTGAGSLARLRTAWDLRRRLYDVVFNLHGGTTATFFTAATGASHRIGVSSYQYSFLHNHLAGPASDFWGRPAVHSAEQQLALLGFAGIPIEDRPKSRLSVLDAEKRSIRDRLSRAGLGGAAYALFHPSTAFFTKQWAAANFARVAEYLAERGYATVAVASRAERDVLENLRGLSQVPVITFDDLSLPEITALASEAALFVGNDSGVAHMAAAVNIPSVVIFGSSNRDHWRPWTDAPSEIVYTEFKCQPCPGYECREFGEPRCILEVPTGRVIEAIERVLEKQKKADTGAHLSDRVMT